MKIALIVAMARNNAIGKDNSMPWHLPEDLRYFKRMTLGKPVVMGRNTFESIGRPLPQRPNIVITRNGSYRINGATVVHSLDAALMLGQTLLQGQGEEAELMVIGGAQIYAQALPLAQRLYLTEVQAEPEGDAFFPAFAREEWRELRRETHKACEHNPHDYDFVVLERRQA